ncbi:MAG: F0F1 ATP synthase subunit B [Parcubacteria group bacterium]|jgi:F-type H+-transporting ATPase subunit b
MSELLTKLGIDWKLLVAQIINFLVLLFVLYKFAYRPLLAMLEKRTKKIEQGLKDAELSHKQLEESEKRQAEVLHKARLEAKDIVEKAREQAEKGRSEIVAESKTQSDKLISDARAQIEQEKQKMFSEIKSEIGGLVVAATEKIIDEKLSSEKDKNLIEKVIK